MKSSIQLSANSALSWLFKIFMLAAIGFLFLTHQFLLGVFATIALLISFIPALIDHSYDTNLPWPIDFWLTIWLTLSVVGSAGFYDHFHWWDSALHLGGSSVLSYLAFVLIFAFSFTGKLQLTIPFIGFFTFLVGVAFGALWELLEFWTWQMTGVDVLAGQGDPALSLFDTFADLQLDLVGSVIVSLGGMYYVGRQRRRYLLPWLAPLVRVLGGRLVRLRVLGRRSVDKIAKHNLKRSKHSRSRGRG